jgi:hypothetical protein
MRFEAIKTPSGVTLIFTGDGSIKSMGIDTGAVKRMTVDEAIAMMAERLLAMLPPAVEDFEIDDEDDEDVSLYEEEVVVDGYSPREYLKSIGAV